MKVWLSLGEDRAKEKAIEAESGIKARNAEHGIVERGIVERGIVERGIVERGIVERGTRNAERGIREPSTQN